jgi:hypothetical protein
MQHLVRKINQTVMLSNYLFSRISDKLGGKFEWHQAKTVVPAQALSDLDIILLTSILRSL